MKTLLSLLLIASMPLLALAQPEFQGTEIWTFDGAVCVFGDDVDGDGDMDIMAAAEIEDRFMWWEQTPDAWLPHTLAEAMDGAGDITTADLDGDGDLDMVGTCYNDNMIWFEQLADGSFTQHLIEEYQDCKTVLPYDMDDDDDLDLVVSANIMEEVVWIENQGNDDWFVHVIDTATDGVWGMVIDDFDLDGDIDIATVARTDDTFTWYENDGDNNFTEHLISSLDYAHGIDKGDIDGDGDMDIVTSSRNEDNVAWWENTLPNDWVRHDISNNFDGADDVHVSDLDGDGDMDIIGAAANADEVGWWEQDGGSWNYYIIDAAADYVSAVWASDMDDDGDVDVLSATYYGDNVMLYTQLGTPGPVSFSLTPGNTVIPAGGGTLNYTVDIESSLPNAVPNLNYWTYVTLPSGQEYGPLVTVPFTLQAGMDVTVATSQNIPALAPAGAYTFMGYIGFMGNPDLQLMDDFGFTKDGAQATGFAFNPADWAGAEPDFATAGGDGGVVSLPARYQLSAAYPNPFNSATRFDVQLPETADLSVAVYNVQGQRVATLAQGQFGAGSHAFVFEASALGTGTYFVKALVPGQLNQVRKVTYVK